MSEINNSKREKQFLETRSLLLPLFKEQILNRASEYNANGVELLEQAFEIGLEAHLYQKRHSGEPYFVHCIAVASILLDLRMDLATILAGLLHDTIEDTELSYEDLQDRFGREVADLVNGVTKIGGIRFKSQEIRQVETFRKMLLHMADDIRVIIIKFADRLHNMRTLSHVPEVKRPRIAMETKEVYAPLAHRLGISWIKTELEDLAMKYLEPETFQELEKKIELTQEEREAYIRKIADPVFRELSSHKIGATIQGRPKSYCSIQIKIEKRKRPFEEIYDLFAIRIIVDKLEECYYALGIVHSLFMPVYDRFKDYIAMPKLNGYQSLHTTVVGPEGKMVEIQIRSWDMHRMAEDGIAAHWKYKEGIQGSTYFDKHIKWVRDLLERQTSDEDPEDFIENLKIDLFQDEVFVFTPKGDLYKMPIGSTTIDFAYMVHTNIGNHCIAAKVNGRIVPLKTKLKSGEQVEIITSQNQKPSQDWLNYVSTSKARHWIKKIIREEQQSQTLQFGKELFDKFLKKHKLRSDSQEINDLLPKLGFQTVDSLMSAIGSGEIIVENLARKLFPEKAEAEPPAKENMFVRFLKRARTTSGIKVQGMDNILINFAKCCQPVPGDRIIGYLTRGKGITIHRTDCSNMVKLYDDRERVIDVDWNIEKGQNFQVHLDILGEDRKNLLKDITHVVSKMEINIITAFFSTEDLYAKGHLVIGVQDLQQLNKIMNSIRKIGGVFSVERIDNTGTS